MTDHKYRLAEIDGGWGVFAAYAQGEWAGWWQLVGSFADKERAVDYASWQNLERMEKAFAERKAPASAKPAQVMRDPPPPPPPAASTASGAGSKKVLGRRSAPRLPRGKDGLTPRARTVLSAMERLASRGTTAVTLRQLAAEAKVPQGSLYHYCGILQAKGLVKQDHRARRVLTSNPDPAAEKKPAADPIKEALVKSAATQAGAFNPALKLPSASVPDKQTEIARHIAEKGATKLPPAVAKGAIPVDKDLVWDSERKRFVHPRDVAIVPAPPTNG